MYPNLWGSNFIHRAWDLMSDSLLQDKAFIPHRDKEMSFSDGDEEKPPPVVNKHVSTPPAQLPAHKVTIGMSSLGFTSLSLCSRSHIACIFVCNTLVMCHRPQSVRLRHLRSSELVTHLPPYVGSFTCPGLDTRVQGITALSHCQHTGESKQSDLPKVTCMETSNSFEPKGCEGDN
jgi:hypothetical protein